MMIRLLLAIVGTMATFGVSAGGRLPSRSLEDTFRSPLPSARPETWWHWMNGNVSREGIVSDLDAMAAIGIGGVHIFDAGCAMPAGPLAFNTPEWFDTVRFAVSEAAKRRMSVTLANCSGYSAAGGPWIAPSNAMKTVCYTVTDVKGPMQFDDVIPQPADPFGFYEDIAVLAYPVPAAELPTMEDAGGRVVSNASGTSTVCTVAFPTPYRASAVAFRLGGKGWDIPARIRLEAEVHGGWKRLLDEETYAVAQGQVDDNMRAFQFETTTAARWRLVFSFPQAAGSFSIKDVRLTRGLRIPNIANKACFLRSYERMRPYRVASDQIVSRSSVVDLSTMMERDGSLRWSVPQGAWRILRIGYAANGKCCHPASVKGAGYESDKLSKHATDLHFDAYIGKMCNVLGPGLAGNVEAGFNAVLVDSWEAGSQNWTQGFAEEFCRRKGYDIRPYLPVLSGAVMEDKETSERFLSDYRDVVSHLFAENFADELARKCHERGLKLVLEPYGTFPSTPELYIRAADVPMCEFWVPPAYGLDDRTVRLVSDLVHANRPSAVIAAESFTGKSEESRWQQDPFSLKAVGDKMYAIGVNRIVYHRYAHQPWTDARYAPGMTMGRWGMHFERTETWWYEAKDWISYQTRCQALLQAGVYVDSCRNPDLRWLERRYDDGTVGFFVACGNPEAITVKLELPLVGESVELWDAETGEISLADDWYVEDGRTRLSLELKPSGSMFVMFRSQPTKGASVKRAFSPSSERAVSGPWDVSFTATYDPPCPIVLDRLMSLSEHPLADVRYFSGSATYRTRLECTRAADERMVLDLGDVKNIADVAVNGRKYPVLWRPPFRVDVTDAIEEGSTTVDLSVRVVNLWVNRLIGDEGLPPDVKWRGEGLAEIPDWVKRGEKSPTGRHTFTTWHHWKKGDPLPQSGLMGPVRLLVGS